MHVRNGHQSIYYLLFLLQLNLISHSGDGECCYNYAVPFVRLRCRATETKALRERVVIDFELRYLPRKTTLSVLKLKIKDAYSSS